MAELALGLTKTVVEAAISRIQSAIDEEGKLQEGVTQDLSFIIDEFQMMQAVLKVANKERARKNEVVRTWVRQLRDLAFDVEDWVELAAHLDKDKPRCGCLWHLLPRCVPMPARDLDEAAATMKVLKSRVENVSLRTSRYNLFIGDDDSGSSNFTPSSGHDLSPSAFWFLRHVWIDYMERLQNVGSLHNLITRELRGHDDLRVIWLWRGDDSLASYHMDMAYHDPDTCNWFDLRAWVKLTRPFKLDEFLNTLLVLLGGGSSHHHQAGNGVTGRELMQQVTNEKRYLVILEGVSDLREWNTISMCLPDNNKGSRIIVSTQHLGIVHFAMGAQYLVSELAQFPDDRRPSLCAFYKKVNHACQETKQKN